MRIDFLFQLMEFKMFPDFGCCHSHFPPGVVAGSPWAEDGRNRPRQSGEPEWPTPIGTFERVEPHRLDLM